MRAIVDRVVDAYGPVVGGIENDVDEIENEVSGVFPMFKRRGWI